VAGDLTESMPQRDPAVGLRHSSARAFGRSSRFTLSLSTTEQAGL